MPPEPSLPRDGATKPCPACGAEVAYRARYCPACGAYLNPRIDRIRRHVAAKSKWHSIRFIIAFYTIYLGTTAPLYFLEPEDSGIGILVVGGLDVIIILYAWRRSGLSLSGLGGFGRRVTHTTIVGAALLLPLLGLNIAYHRTIIRLFGIEESIAISDLFLDHGFGWPWLILGICLMPGIMEEIAFRGLIWNSFERAGQTSRQAWILSSALFSIIHVDLGSMPYLFLVGLFLGLGRRASGSILPGILLHVLHNFSVILIEQFATF